MVKIRDMRFIMESELEAGRGDLGLNLRLSKYRQQELFGFHRIFKKPRELRAILLNDKMFSK